MMDTLCRNANAYQDPFVNWRGQSYLSNEIVTYYVKYINHDLTVPKRNESYKNILTCITSYLELRRSFTISNDLSFVTDRT